MAHSVQAADQAGTGVLASNRVYSAGVYERKHVQTADGSAIWLNDGSSILVSFTAEVRSVVLLCGETLFNVKHDSRHPFRVFRGRSVAEDVGKKDGRVHFAETPLDEAVAEFNHYSQIKIELAPDVQQLGLRI